MSFTKPATSPYRGGGVPDVDPTKCAAYGCRCRATASVGGRPFACSIHAAMESEDWPRVTSRLEEFGWLVGFIDEVQKMDRKHEDWRSFATQFWQGVEDQCIPHQQEAAVPYQIRMRNELLWRVGGLSKRPQPRLPRVVAPRGFFANRGTA